VAADRTEPTREELVATLLTATPKLRGALFTNPLRLNVGALESLPSPDGTKNGGAPEEQDVPAPTGSG